MSKLILEFVRQDTYCRPVYKCGDKYYVDIDSRAWMPPNIYAKKDNSIDGDPSRRVLGYEFEFMPMRDTWDNESVVS